jgi:hypothetical protein
VEAEAEARGLTAAQPAAAIIATRNAWEPIGIEIERARIAGKVAVGAAHTVGDVSAAVGSAEEVLGRFSQPR